MAVTVAEANRIAQLVDDAVNAAGDRTLAIVAACALPGCPDCGASCDALGKLRRDRHRIGCKWRGGE